MIVQTVTQPGVVKAVLVFLLVNLVLAALIRLAIRHEMRGRAGQGGVDAPGWVTTLLEAIVSTSGLKGLGDRFNTVLGRLLEIFMAVVGTVLSATIFGVLTSAFVGSIGASSTVPPETLPDMRIGTLEGSTAQQFLIAQYAAADLSQTGAVCVPAAQATEESGCLLYPGWPAAVQALDKGEVAAVLGDWIALSYLSRLDRYNGRIEVQSGVYLNEPDGWAVAPDRPALREGGDSGRHLLRLQGRAGRAAGYDISPGALNLLRARAGAAAWHDLAILGPDPGDLDRQLADCGPADLVLCLFGVLGHIETAPARQAALARMRHALKPGTGRLLISVPNRRRGVRPRDAAPRKRAARKLAFEPWRAALAGWAADPALPRGAGLWHPRGGRAMRWLTLLLLALLWCAAPTPAQPQDTLRAELPADPSGRLAHILRRGTLIVGVKSDYPPWGMVDPDPASDALVGIEPDLARDIADRLGVGLKLVSVTARNRIGRVNDGTVDLVIATMGDTAVRRTQADLIQPNYFSSGVVVYGRIDLGLSGWDALRGAPVCLTQGAYFNRTLECDYGLKGQYFPGNREARLAQLVLAEPDPEFGVIVPTILNVPWAMAVAQGEGDGDWGRFLSDTVGEWHATGRILQLQREWASARPRSCAPCTTHGPASRMAARPARTIPKPGSPRPPAWSRPASAPPPRSRCPPGERPAQGHRHRPARSFRCL
ncbi:transporter substrate-binding domain-containing protein [Rhodovulum marinum]|uniref:ABC-type amino acid transport substrate-binding protein n=1 Tax=Rhodovulum marinum TaxID=320662 RepID=A0A4R2PVP1_9RHOB|nr:transporter substrate-binding domain-containing protein [Rhodovulum marinum]TCP40173.1 ABC-type amino acid transport substrate-binding protein [Rhodovulum marinum]